MCISAPAPTGNRGKGMAEEKTRRREGGGKHSEAGSTVRQEGRLEERWRERDHSSGQEWGEGVGTFSLISSARWHSGSASLYLPLLP